MTDATFYPSSPIDIRDGTFNRVMAIPAFGGRVYRQRTMPTKDAGLPLACVWFAGERTDPMGDANTGPPSFDHTLTMIVDVIASGANETALDATIVNLVQTVRSTLLTDATWVMLFEGCSRCDTRYDYPKETDFFMAQGLIEFELTYRSIWDPVVPNDFDLVDLTVERPGSPTTFEQQFDIPQD